MRLLIYIMFFFFTLSSQAQGESNLCYSYHPATFEGNIAGLINCIYIKGEVNSLISKWGQEEVKKELINYCENKENSNRFKALRILGDINDPSLILYITAYLGDASTYGPRGIAISALGRQGFPDAAAPIGRFLNETNGHKDTWFAIVALGHITTNEAAAYIEGFLNENLGYRKYNKAQLILTRIKEYNDGRSKKRMLKQLLRDEGERFAWAISKLYQPNSPNISFSFLRGLCEKERRDSGESESRYITLLELREYLGGKMTEEEEKEIYISRGERD